MNTNKRAAGANGGRAGNIVLQSYQIQRPVQPFASLVGVNRSAPCPVCGRDHWCSVAADGSLCICRRVGAGATSRSRDGGYVHVLAPSGRMPPGRCVCVASHLPRRSDLPALAAGYAAAVTPSLLRGLADRLGVTERSLRRLRTGWAFDGGRGPSGAGALFDAGDVVRVDPAGVTWSFPIVDPADRVVGIRLRHPDGGKTAVVGSRDGLFVPDGLRLPRPSTAGRVRGGRLLVTEARPTAPPCWTWGSTPSGGPAAPAGCGR